jgi:radical SAM superfamily enzyme YgiQ (UPF0313 family)
MAGNNRVFIVYPPLSKMERYSSKLGSVGGEQLPLGIYYLASYLRNNGYEVKVCDAEAEKLLLEDIIKQVQDFAPAVIGISSTTVAFHRALELAEAVKGAFNGMTVVLGGAHVTSNADHALAFAAFDFGVIGEGEITFVELLNSLGSGGSVADVAGIAFRDTSGKVVRTTPREYIANLDILPFPAYDLVQDIGMYAPPPSNYKTLPVMNIITSRGCPNDCTFCDRNIFGKKYRERSAANVFAEIKYLRDNYGVKELAFVDDTFLINKERVRELFDIIRREGLFFPWTCMARINNVTFEFLKFLKENGCWSIAFGIESADEGVLKIIRKNISPEKVRTVIDWCHELGIETKGFFIVGHPTETLATIDKTIAFAASLKLSAVVVTINTPIPGSPQYAEAHQYGTLDTTDWARFNYWRPVFVPFGLTEELLLKKQEEFYLRFYMRPRIVGKYLRSFFGAGGMRRLKSILSIFVSRDSITKVARFLLGRK